MEARREASNSNALTDILAAHFPCDPYPHFRDSLSNRGFFFASSLYFFMQSKGFSCVDYICLKKEPGCGSLLTSDFHICQYNPGLVIICTVVELSFRLNLSGLGEMWGLIPPNERPNRPWLTACIQARERCIIIYHLLSFYCYWLGECC